jgi:hypothetical protein
MTDLIKWLITCRKINRDSIQLLPVPSENLILWSRVLTRQ